MLVCWNTLVYSDVLGFAPVLRFLTQLLNYVTHTRTAKILYIVRVNNLVDNGNVKITQHALKVSDRVFKVSDRVFKVSDRVFKVSKLVTLMLNDQGKLLRLIRDGRQTLRRQATSPLQSSLCTLQLQ